MPERLKPEPAYDSGWTDPSVSGQDEDPLAELARLVQGVGTPSQPLVRPAPPRGESGFRTPASRFAPPSSAAPAPLPPVTQELSDFDHTDLAADLEAELMRDLQDSFAAVRAPIEQQPSPPEFGPSHTDELDFDAFADMHLRQSNPMDAPRSAPRQQPELRQQPEEPPGIESLASWREVKEGRFKPKGAAPIIRPRNESGEHAAAATRAPERAAPRALQADPIADSIADDPDIAAVAAMADSFARSPVREPQPRGYDSREPTIMPEEFSAVPGYGHAAMYEEEDDEPAPRAQRGGGRKGLVLVASLLGVVLVGTLAVFGFKGLSGGGDSGDVPVIAADTTPTKTRAADSGSSTTDSGKLVYDRIGGNDDTATGSLAPEDTVTTVPRPESQSTEASREISRIILPDPRDPPVPEDQTATASSPSAEESAVGPKRVRTVVVRPDGTIVSSTAGPATAAAETSAPAQVRTNTVATTETTADTRPAPAPVVTDERPPQPAKTQAKPEEEDTTALGDDFEEGIPLASDEEPDATTPAVRGTQPADVAKAPQDIGPISLLPKATSKPKPPTKPVEREVAAVEPQAEVDVAPAPAAAATGNYYVQLSSQRSQSAAADSYRDMQRRFSNILANRSPDIRKADLGEKGIYYRARVGPGMSSAEANKLCSALKSAGGDCIVTAN